MLLLYRNMTETLFMCLQLIYGDTWTGLGTGTYQELFRVKAQILWCTPVLSAEKARQAAYRVAKSKFKAVDAGERFSGGARQPK